MIDKSSIMQAIEKDMLENKLLENSSTIYESKNTRQYFVWHATKRKNDNEIVVRIYNRWFDKKETQYQEAFKFTNTIGFEEEEKE